MRTLSSRSLLGAAVVLTSTLAGFSGCTVDARPEHVRYSQPQPVYQATPVYEQPTYQAPPPPSYGGPRYGGPDYAPPAPVYQAPPPPPPQVIVERRPDGRDVRALAMDALGHLRQADSQVVPNHLEPSKEHLRAAREALKHAGRDPVVDDALNRIDAALDAAEHSRPRIEQDHIHEAIQVLHERYEGRR